MSRDRVLASDNVELPAGAGFILWAGMVFVGLLLTAGAVLGGMTSATSAAVSLHAIHTGFLAAISWPLGALGFVLILHLVKAGWAVTARRQFENLMSLVWVGAIMFIVVVALQLLYTTFHSADVPAKDAPYLWNWMNADYVKGDSLYTKKAAFLNEGFFAVRAFIYFAVWMGLARALGSLSRRQDADGDRWHSATAVRIAAPGILLFAFTLAFAGFDWLMALDHHWFSTMLGVYFFAISIAGALALGTLSLIALRAFGRLHGAFTVEHQHDLAKLVFAFIVFWAYIAFSQYFLIWYANIPEETAFYIVRKGGTDVEGAALWQALSWFVPIGKFIIPFVILLPRPLRRIPGLVALVCVWILFMGCVELYWMVRPEVEAGFRWMDIAGVFGPPLIMLGLFVRQISKAPLVPLQDPRMDEALHHRNTI